MGRQPLHILLLFITALSIINACAPSAPIPASITHTPSRIEGKVDVGGYALKILCIGQGTPTVIIETSFGDPGVESPHWKAVRSEVEKTTRVCVYDRAGLGSSDVAPGENRTSQDMVEGLHTLLVNANVPGPYILVGHSIGGYHARLFAGQYPDEVVGIVLVDSSHPDQWERALAVLPPESPDEPETLRQLRIVPPASLPEKMDIITSADQVRTVSSFGDIPLIVLSHSLTWRFPDLPPELADKIEEVWQNLQNDLATLSSNSTHIIATKSGHYIQVDEPQLVIDAILKILSETKQ